jgi:peptide/nickel transport system substrate-binding protein
VFKAKLEEAGNDFSAVQKEKIDQNPVVSGPYNLINHSSEKIVLERRDDYWGNAVFHKGQHSKPEFIIHPIYKSNDHFSIALQQGNLDVSSTFIPRIWLKYKRGVRTWFKEEPFHVPASITMFVFNTTKYPLSDKHFRRALAHAVQYRDIRELAVSGYSPPLKSGLIMPFGIEKKYYSEEDVQMHGVSFNPGKAGQILAQAGYISEFDNNGKLVHMKNAAGEIVPTIFIKSPAGWTDWESMVNIAVKSLRAAGFDVREGFCDAGNYWQSIPVGEFDILMTSPSPAVTPSKPWSRFEHVMSSRNWKPVGEKMNENQGRYNNPHSREYNPEVDRLLKAIPTITDETERKTAYRRLNRIVMQDLPALPLVYRPEQFYEFSTKNWANFADSENPYAPPQLPCFGIGRKMLWHIKPVTEE